MYSTIKQYHDFLEKQESERELVLSQTKIQVNNQMDEFMSEHGWVRKCEGQKVTFTKKFNGKNIVVEFRCNYGKDYKGGLPEFVHSKSIPHSVDKIQMGYFHWNDQDTSGWGLDVVMERMEVFYDKYTK
jgi:hypothetical protein